MKTMQTKSADSTMHNLVAVYGTLRKGHHNHSKYMRTAVFRGYIKITDRYKMYSLGHFPAVVKAEGFDVYAEVYSVSDIAFKRLDSLEGYPTMYDREQISTPYGDAWIYYMKEDPNAKLIQDGDWVKFSDKNSF